MRTSVATIAMLSGLAFCPLASAQLPTVETGGSLSVYATFPTDPGEISFDAADNLFVANFNNPGPPGGPALVWVVRPADSLVSACASVDDPDAVYVDRNGLLASPGSLLVGGLQGSTTVGQIVAVSPGCGGASQIVNGGCVENVHMFAEDALGRLFVTNATALTVCMWNGTGWSMFLPSATGIPRIAIDGNDIYVSRNGTVRRYNSAGVLVDPAFATGAVHAVGPAGTEFAGVIVERTNLLVAINPVTRAETRILSGAGSTGNQVTFDSAGDLYISQGGTFDRVLHLTRGASTGVAQAAGMGAGTELHVSPNPATRAAAILFATRTPGSAQLDLLDASGRRVLRIYEGVLSDGRFSGNVDLAHLARGVYFVSALTREGRSTEKLVLVR